MEIIQLPQQIFKFTVQDFESIKQTLLDKIFSYGTNTIKNPDTCIYHTDYYLPLQHSSLNLYKQDALNIIEPFLKEICHTYKINAKVDKIWSQSYKQNDYHMAHTHGGNNYSSVLYLELPENTQTTFYTDYNKTTELKIDVKEGDYIIFPSSAMHESKPIICNQRKTILSFNIDLE